MIFAHNRYIILLFALAWLQNAHAYSLPEGVNVLESDTPGDVSTRIVGGSPAALGEYDFYVNSMQNSLCGGTLIHDDMILTAAHCGNAFLVGNDVLVGSVDRRYATEGGVKRSIAKAIKHPQYSSFTQNFDFMVVKLTEPVWTIAPARLNDDFSFPEDDDTATVIGFGATSEGGSIATYLQKVDVPIVKHSDCAQQYNSPIVKKSMLCAGKEGFDSCQGDSGGPLMAKNENTGETIVVGVVSFGVGCARASHAGVYARVSAVNDWVRQEICNNSMLKPSYCYPTPSPTPMPTDKPTPTPTTRPTNSPVTNEPTPVPSSSPTRAPTTLNPTKSPTTEQPTSTPTRKPTTQPSSNPTITPPTSATLRISISYGFDPEPQGRFWEIEQGGNEIRKGPEKVPQPNTNEDVFIDDLPFGHYDFSAYDLSINGSSDWIRIYQQSPTPDTPDVLLTEGGGSFIYKMQMPFTVSENPIPFDPQETESQPPTTSPTARPTTQAPPGAKVKISITYDENPSQTIWRFRKGYSQYIFWGPVSTPPAFSTQEEIFEDLEFGNDYNILFSDAGYDGFGPRDNRPPFVSVVQMMPDGTEEPVVSSNVAFGYSYKLNFALNPPPTASPVSPDTTATTTTPSSSPVTTNPTTHPTSGPTASPTASPTALPTKSPASGPTATPTASSTTSPTATVAPTVVPTTVPTTSPMAAATLPITATVKIRVRYDDEPSQTTWRVRKGFSNYLFWGPQQVPPPFADVTETFEGLQFGSDYAIQFSDRGYNGFKAGQDGQPFVVVSRILYDGTEEELARSDATFSYGHVVYFSLEPETWAPTTSPTTATPTSSPTSSPTTSPTTSSPTSSPTVSTNPTSSPTTSPTTSPMEAPTTAKVKVVVKYDSFPEHTEWEIRQGDTLIFNGPVLTPAANSTQTQTWSVFPLGSYTFTIFDNADNGMTHLDYFRIYKILDDGTEELIAHGNEAFTSSFSVPFVVSN